MRRALGILVLMASSCAGASSISRASQSEAKRFFERWIDAVVDGNFDRVYDGMSVRFQTLWIWTMVSEPDHPVILEQRKKFSAEVAAQFDQWVGRNVVREEHQVEPLPDAVWQGGWVPETIRAHYLLIQGSLAREFRALSVQSAAVDAAGATILVRNSLGRTEMYVCIHDGRQWRVDGHRPALPGQF